VEVNRRILPGSEFQTENQKDVQSYVDIVTQHRVIGGHSKLVHVPENSRQPFKVERSHVKVKNLTHHNSTTEGRISFKFGENYPVMAATSDPVFSTKSKPVIEIWHTSGTTMKKMAENVFQLLKYGAKQIKQHYELKVLKLTFLYTCSRDIVKNRRKLCQVAKISTLLT